MRQLPVIALLAVLLLAAPAVADVIHLKNGGKIEGVILSETGGELKVRTKAGVMTVARADIARIEKRKTPIEEYEARLDELAPDDAEGRFELALFCKEHGLVKQEKDLYRAVLEIDDQHPGANEAVGNVEHEGVWMTPEERDRALADAADAEKRAQGLVKYKGEWVTPEEKENLEKGLVKYQGKWMTPDEVKEAQGYVKWKGEWIRKEELERRKLVDTYGEWMGIEVNAVLSERFAVVGPYEDAELQQVLDGAELAYQQFLEIFDLDPETARLFDGAEEDGDRTRCHIVYAKKAFDYSRLFDEMAKKYPKDAPFTHGKLAKSLKGFYFVYPACYIVGYQFPNPFQQVRASVVHKASHVLIMRYNYTSGFFPWWLIEGLGTYQEISALGTCDTFCITEGGYGDLEGAGAKKWAGLSRWKAVVKTQVVGLADRSWIRLGKMGLNELDFRDLAKCWSLCEWFIGHHRERFVELVNLIKAKVELRDAVEKAFGKPLEQVEKEWRDYVRSNY